MGAECGGGDPNWAAMLALSNFNSGGQGFAPLLGCKLEVDVGKSLSIKGISPVEKMVRPAFGNAKPTLWQSLLKQLGLTSEELSSGFKKAKDSASPDAIYGTAQIQVAEVSAQPGGFVPGPTPSPQYDSGVQIG